MKTLPLALILTLTSACGQAPTADDISSGLTTSQTTQTTPTLPSYLADPSNPFLNGRWRATQTICASQAPVAVSYQQDLIFSGGFAKLELDAGGSCGMKPTYDYEVGYSGASLTMATYAYTAYNGACAGTTTTYNPPSYLTFSVQVSGATLSLTRNTNCDGNGGAYVTQYQYISAQ